LPKTVTRQRRDCNSNPCSSEPESDTLTTQPPSHPKYVACGRTFLQERIGLRFIFTFEIRRRFCIVDARRGVVAVVLVSMVCRAGRRRVVCVCAVWTQLVSEFCRLDLTCPVPGCGPHEVRSLIMEGMLRLRDNSAKVCERRLADETNRLSLCFDADHHIIS